MNESQTEERLDQKVDLHELILRGADYREAREFDYLGVTTEVVMKPMIDEYAIPLTAALHAKFEMDVSEAREEVEEAREEDGTIDVTALDEEFVGLMRRAARHSIDRDANGWTEEQFNDIVGSDPADPSIPDQKAKTVDGLIVDLGMEGFELAGSLEDAKLFRGRGTQ